MARVYIFLRHQATNLFLQFDEVAYTAQITPLQEMPLSTEFLTRAL